MSPFLARTTTMMRFDPNNWVRYLKKVSMYSWPIGSCLSKPAVMCSCVASQPMTRVNTSSTASVATRKRKKKFSSVLTKLTMLGIEREILGFRW